eukprot:c26697_g1_i1 orf=127-2067(+)
MASSSFMSLICRCMCLLLLALLSVNYALAASVSPAEAAQIRDEVRDMFYHGFDGYMQYAFPLDELRPSSCMGEDTLGGYALTLVDAMDMLALLGDRPRFSEAVHWVGKNLRFDKNKTVSVFETNIRILGGLLSAHLIASDASTGMQMDGYDDELLHLAEDLGRRLLPAFETPTGIPYGSVNLLYGVSDDESKVTSTAGGGTLILEFGVLSRLTKNPVFETVARNAVRGLWAQRSQLGLVGAHINVFSGEWTHKDAGIGTSIDSFYEYLLKGYLLLGDEEYLYIFNEAYKAAMRYLYSDPWYFEVNMNSAVVVWPLFNSLQAFWPGLQVLAGDVEPAIRTHRAFFSVWKKFGFTPEGFNLATFSVQPGQKGYPLRPELIESTYWLYKATKDPVYLDVGRDIVTSLQYGARCPCGYCHIADVESHTQEDHMESFFLAETVKYLWLLFDLAVGGDNMVEKGPYPFVFSTEGHMFPMTHEISLSAEHCTYIGSFCHESAVSELRWFNLTETGDSNAFPFKTSSGIDHWCSASQHVKGQDKSENFDEHIAPLKGVCPGYGYWQQFGIHSFKDVPVSHSYRKTHHKEQQQTLHQRLVHIVQTAAELQKDRLTEQLDTQLSRRPQEESSEQTIAMNRSKSMEVVSNFSQREEA